MSALEELRAQGRLPVRVYAMLSARDEKLVRAWIAKGPDAGDGWLAVRSVKAYYDGALGSRGALLLEDYADRPGHRGVGELLSGTIRLTVVGGRIAYPKEKPPNP